MENRKDELEYQDELSDLTKRVESLNKHPHLGWQSTCFGEVMDLIVKDRAKSRAAGVRSAYEQLESSLRDVGLKLSGNLDAMICAVMKAHHADEDHETQQERWNAVRDTDWSSWKPLLDKDTLSKLEKSETVALQLTSFLSWVQRYSFGAQAERMAFGKGDYDVDAWKRMVDGLDMLETGDRDNFKITIWKVFEWWLEKVVTSSRGAVVRGIADPVAVPRDLASFDVAQLEVKAEQV